MNSKYFYFIWFGGVLASISLYTMLSLHEFAISEIVFIIGVCIAGFAYAKMPKDKPQINTEQISKNIQTLNDILWGDEKKP